MVLQEGIPKLEQASGSSEGFVKRQIAGPLRVSDLVGMGWGPGTCISNKFPDDVDAPGQEPHLDHCLRTSEIENGWKNVLLLGTLPWADHGLCSLELNLASVKSPREVGLYSRKQHTKMGVLLTGKKVGGYRSLLLAGVNRSL